MKLFRISAVVFLCLHLFCFCSVTFGATESYFATASAGIDSDQPGDALGANVYYQAGFYIYSEVRWYNYLVKFDLSGIPCGSTITDVSIIMNCQNGDSTFPNWLISLKAERLIKLWETSTVTWNNQPDIYPVPLGHIDFDDSTHTIIGNSSNLTYLISTVQGWVDGTYPNHGLMFSSNQDPGTGYEAKTDIFASAGGRAELLVTYTLPTPLQITQDIPASAEVCEGTPYSYSTQVTDGSGVPHYQWKKDGSNVGTDSSSYNATDIGVYWCEITDDCETIETVHSSLSIKYEPVITAHPIPPVAGWICQEQSHRFSVAATGFEPLGYQWKLDGVDIAGEDAYEIFATDPGLYTCIVSNECNLIGVESNVAELIVNSAPVVTHDPIQIPSIVCQGDDVTFTVQATSGLPMDYQWEMNGNPIGINDPNLIINNVGIGDNGAQIICVISNACGPAATSPATLQVGECSTLFVDQSATGLDNGISWTDAFNSLSGCIRSSCEFRSCF